MFDIRIMRYRRILITRQRRIIEMRPHSRAVWIIRSLSHFEVSQQKKKMKIRIDPFVRRNRKERIVDEQRKGQEETHTKILPRIPCLVNTTFSRATSSKAPARERWYTLRVTNIGNAHRKRKEKRNNASKLSCLIRLRE